VLRLQPQQSPTGEPAGDRSAMLPFALVNFLNSLNIDVIIVFPFFSRCGSSESFQLLLSMSFYSLNGQQHVTLHTITVINANSFEIRAVKDIIILPLSHYVVFFFHSLLQLVISMLTLIFMSSFTQSIRLFLGTLVEAGLY
jgi:hypothetical protein